MSTIAAMHVNFFLQWGMWGLSAASDHVFVAAPSEDFICLFVFMGRIY